MNTQNTTTNQPAQHLRDGKLKATIWRNTTEKGIHHSLIEYLAEIGETEGPLFRSINRQRTGFTNRRLDRREALAIVKRRTKAAGLGGKFSNHTLRGTRITAYLTNDGQPERAQYMAGHASPTTTKLYDRREQETTLDEVERIIL